MNYQKKIMEGRKLLSLVPDAALFQGVLLLVKHWARLRGIYGSTFGYFSGLAWALVAAKACIKHEGSQEMQDFDGFLQCIFFDS